MSLLILALFINQRLTSDIVRVPLSNQIMRSQASTSYNRSINSRHASSGALAFLVVEWKIFFPHASAKLIEQPRKG